MNLARTLLGDPVATWELALLNGMDERTLLREGQLVKYIARETRGDAYRP